MPDGPGEDVSPPGAYLQYNEVRDACFHVSFADYLLGIAQYIVYDPAQIRVRYLLMVKM